MRVKEIILCLTFLLIVSCNEKPKIAEVPQEKIIPVFQSNISPGESSNCYFIDTTVNLYSEPDLSSEAAGTINGSDSRIEYPDVLYKTIRAGLLKVKSPMKAEGVIWGDVKNINIDDFDKMKDTVMSFNLGDTIQFLQNYSEGWAFYKINNIVLELFFTNYDVETLADNETELWFNTKNSNGTQGWVLVEDKKVRQVYCR